MNNRSLCWARLPRAGLGNLLLVWARAWVFARINEIPLFLTGWNVFRPGPLIRGELPRFYSRYFARCNEISRAKFTVARYRFRRVIEPTLAKQPVDRRILYVFSAMPHWRDYFAGIRDHREDLREALDRMLAPKVREIISHSARPVVSVHVRRGDFRELQPGEDFAKVGLVRTPLSYFADVIHDLRLLAGVDLPVTIFSDGPESELGELLRMGNVHYRTPSAAIADLLLMASSKIIVTSPSSTFSYWAGFLSDGAVILHPDHIHRAIRPAEVNCRSYEGPVRDSMNEWPVALKRYMQVACMKAQEHSDSSFYYS